MTPANRIASSEWQRIAARVLGAIYRDRTGESWAEALDEICRLHNSSWAHIHIDDELFAEARLSVPNVSADPELLPRMIREGYAPLDPRPEILASLDGEVRACWQIVDADAFDRSVFVNEFLDQPENDLRWSVATGKILSTGARYLFGIARPRSAGAFQEGDIHALEQLAPHITGAMELHESVRAAERLALGQMQAQGHQADAVLGLDRRGRLVYASPGSERVIARLTEQRSAIGPVRFRSPAVKSAVEAALSQRRDAPPMQLAADNMTLRFLRLPPVSGLRPGDLEPACVLVEVRVALDAGSTRLTRREMEVATMLANGRTLVEIAAHKGRSLDTVRTQLKSVMRKTGANSQAQVVRLMLQRGTVPWE